MYSSKKFSECSRSWRGVLLKDGKLICDIQSYNVPFELPSSLNIHDMDAEVLFPLSMLRSFQFHPLAPNPARLVEWQRFLKFLVSNNKVAIVWFPGWELLINPPLKGLVHSNQIHPKQSVTVSYRQKGSVVKNQHVPYHPSLLHGTQNWHFAAGHKGMEQSQLSSPASRMDRGLELGQMQDLRTLAPKPPTTYNLQPIVVQTHPSYLETLGQNHASWIFGALAELIDNARDAQATRLEISIQEEYTKQAGSHIPVLYVTDNGTGMDYASIVRMISFGHKKPENDNEDAIGRFGVGFKTGSMRLGKDVVVFTQCKETRSIAFLSRSYNEGREGVEIPILSYQKSGGWMEFDLQFHTQEQAEIRLKAIKEFSPFNEYSIGHKFSVFGEGTGTTICIYNLDKWGSDYSLQWQSKSSSEDEPRSVRDIAIRSRRVRTRPSQMTKEVPLDYSLHAYLEVMFLEPRMKIYVQGTLVKTKQICKTLSKTRVYRGTLLGRKVELTLGSSQEEKSRGNCGIFLYWHGRLIEAYKRVGGMVHSADMGLGVIGVIDVTDIMNLENGRTAVLNNKQGFQDCEAYCTLVDWLGNNANAYWDEHFDSLKLEEKDKNAVYTPDNSWVQCNKCLKWRVLPEHFDASELPDEWFCYMFPFEGLCSTAEGEVDASIHTMTATRTHANLDVATKADEVTEVSMTLRTSSLSNDKESSNLSDVNDYNASCIESLPLRKVSKVRKAQPNLEVHHPPSRKFQKTC